MPTSLTAISWVALVLLLLACSAARAMPNGNRIGEFSALDSLEQAQELERPFFDERRGRDVSELRPVHATELTNVQLALQAERLALIEKRQRLLLSLATIGGLLASILIPFYRMRLQDLQEHYERNRDSVHDQLAPFAQRHGKSRSGSTRNDSIVQPAASPPAEAPAVSAPASDNEEDEPLLKLFQRLEAAMTEQQLFADRDLSIGSLASRLGTNQKYLSTAISRYGSGHFNQYVNRHRIHEATRILSGAEPGPGIQSLMERTGFNSRSAFYTAFRQQTGMTPRQYRERSLN